MGAAAHFGRMTRLAGLSAIVPAFGVAGGWLDERAHLGFTNWRSACRASGVSLSSVLIFTLELLPTAVVALLAGGLLVQAFGVFSRYRAEHASTALAAHAGCALSMPVGLILCTLAMPLPVMLAMESLLAITLAWCIHGLMARRPRACIPAHR